MAQNNTIKIKHSIRKLEDLNLMDDFLFQTMMSQEGESEEFARILLSTILGKQIRRVKIIPQKSILGLDSDRHGIRLDAYIETVKDDMLPEGEIFDAKINSDIYDIEPNNSYEKRSLPKRTRYYHALIDTQLLSAGNKYDNMQNVTIIVILPYDPFGRNRMVYTVKNQCEEDSSIPYEDGATQIFLYTKGTEGNPGQALVDMLKYIEKTTDDNVTNQDIESIHSIVKRVKSKREVGINYMKSWEREEMARKEGREEGREEGRNCINELIIKLSDAGRVEDIIRAAEDKEYQEKLLEEFQI